MDEPGSKVLINELMQHHKFLLGQGVDRTERWRSAFVQCDLEIIWSSANLLAFDLLNTSTKSWYSPGMLLISVMVSEVVMD